MFEEVFDTVRRLLRESEEFITNVEKSLLVAVTRFETVARALMSGRRVPSFDVRKVGEEVEIIVDVPGVDKNDIKVWYDEERRILHVEAKRSDRGIEYSLDLQIDIEPSTIRATYRNGVLKIVAKERKEAKKLVEVKVD